jgi:hypothetical protein
MPAPPDFTALLGIAFFLLVLGVVFYLNQALITQMGEWWDRIVRGNVLLRPPEGVISSAVLFFALLGGTYFVIGAVRWAVTRSKIRTLSASLTGVAMVAFAYLLYRYSLTEVSGPFVLSVEAAVVAVLLFTFIFGGIYWTTIAPRPAPSGVSPRQW